MKSATISLPVRILIFLSLWIIAGVIWAILSDFSVEAGNSKFAAQCAMVYMGPLMAAQGLAFVILPGGYNAWPHRQDLEGIIALALLLFFIAHCVITLTRTNKRKFLIWTGIQIAFLLASIASVLYFWHWDALHMHG